MRTAPRRSFWLIAAVPVVLGAAWLLWGWLVVPFPVRAYERLQLGMTASEIEASIGEPPSGSANDPTRDLSFWWGNYSLDSKGLESSCALIDADHPAKLVRLWWAWDQHCIWVLFDDSGHAIGIYLNERTHAPSFFDRLRGKLGF
jgi:hypothetical protein